MKYLMGKLSWMKAISVDIVKENEVVERQEKWLFLGYWNGKENQAWQLGLYGYLS